MELESVIVGDAEILGGACPVSGEIEYRSMP